MQKVCRQFYTLSKKWIDCVELSSIPLCCKIPSRLVPQVSKGPYYGNLFLSEKSAKTENMAINSQLGRPILRFWKSRGPGSISARLAYLAANLKIRKFGVVKITWKLSRIPKTSNFEKKVPEGNASRRIPSRMATNLSNCLYYGNTVFSKNERRALRKAVRAAAP